MKKLELFWYILSIFFIQSCNRGSGKVVTDFNIDLGEIKNHTTKNFFIKVRNEGSRPVKILRVNASCNCIANNFSSLVMTPGSVDSIQFTIQATETGVKHEKIVIHSSGSIKFNIVNIKVKAI